MTVCDVRLMVATEKETRNWVGKKAWKIPYHNLTTTSFEFAVKEWCHFLEVQYDRER